MAPHHSKQTSSHVDVMDGLRAIAIGLVMWLHVWELSWLAPTLSWGSWSLDLSFLPRTGFVGVELFFFVSGFCLFYPHARHRFEGAPLAGLRSYAYRRFIKIVPSYLLAIALILALFKPGFFASPSWLWQLASHLIFVQNLFPETEAAINGVFWSLGVEVQFYVLFPLVAWAFRRRPIVAYLALCAIAVGWRWSLEASQPHAYRFAMNQLPGYLDFFANGMLAAVAIVWLRARGLAGRAVRVAATGMALGALAALAWMLNDLYAARIGAEHWPTRWQVLNRSGLGLGFWALAVGSAFAWRPWRAFLANPLFVFLSAIAYNLYIWHQLLARELMARKIPAPATLDPHADPIWQMSFTFLAMGLAIAVATALTYGFERPLLREGPAWLLKPFRRKQAGTPPPGAPESQAA